MGQFEGKIVLVTGATSGIGQSTAEAFARDGAKVVLTGRREEKGNAVVDKIKDAGGEALFVQTDVRQPEEIKNMVARTVEHFGQLDIAVNNAGVEQVFTPLQEQTLEDFDFIMETNVRGVWLSIQEEAKAMLKSGGGAIVNVSSVAGVIGMPMIPLYVASKHAVVGLTKGLALEFAKQNIRINVVLPGAVSTPMIDRFAKTEETTAYLNSLHPIGRIADAEEVADSILHLASEKASFITGTSLRVDGGFTAQ